NGKSENAMILENIHKREVIPRWRLFSITSNLQELGGLHKKPPKQLDGGYHWALKKDEWARAHTLAAAWSVVAAGIVENAPVEAVDAANFVLQQEVYVPSALKKIAESVVLSPSRLKMATYGRVVELPDHVQPDVKQQIQNLKRELHQGPRDAVAWVDL